MHFESKANRSLWVNWALNLIPDILIAIALASFMDGGILGFLIAIAGFQIVYLLIWIKNSLWTWLMWQWRVRRQVANAISDFLAECKFPLPSNFAKSPDDYFMSVVGDETLPIDVRLKAAAEIGSLRTWASTGSVQQTIRINIAFEDGIARFSQLGRYGTA